MRAACYQSGKMRHVDQEKCANLICNLPHASEVDDARIGAAAADDQLGAFLLRQFLQRVVVNGFGFFGYAVRHDLVSLPGKVKVMAVREMTAMRQGQSQDRVATPQHCS